MEHPGSATLTTAVLAGGHGSRLGGVDKASLDVGGRTVLERVLVAVQPLSREILVITNEPRSFADPAIRVLHDAESHHGVLPALLQALEAATSELLLLVACDMPFLSPVVVQHLLAQAPDHDAVIPHVDGFDQPMHAIYRVEPCVRAILSRPMPSGAPTGREGRMTSFLEHLHWLRVEEAALRALDPDLRSFFNVNTPADLDEARRIAAAER